VGLKLNGIDQLLVEEDMSNTLIINYDFLCLPVGLIQDFLRFEFRVFISCATNFVK
jgi:hypothetical protein